VFEIERKTISTSQTFRCLPVKRA